MPANTRRVTAVRPGRRAADPASARKDFIVDPFVMPFPKACAFKNDKPAETKPSPQAAPQLFKFGWSGGASENAQASSDEPARARDLDASAAAGFPPNPAAESAIFFKFGQESNRAPDGESEQASARVVENKQSTMYMFGSGGFPAGPPGVSAAEPAGGAGAHGPWIFGGAADASHAASSPAHGTWRSPLDVEFQFSASEGGVAPPPDRRGRGAGRIRQRLPVQQRRPATAAQAPPPPESDTPHHESSSSSKAPTTAEKASSEDDSATDEKKEPEAASERIDDATNEWMHKAAGFLRENKYPEAIRLCMQHLSGPQGAADIIEMSLSSWEETDRRRITTLEDEKQRVIAQLNSVRERLEHTKQVCTVEREKRTQAESQRRITEGQIERLRIKVADLEDLRQDNAFLREELLAAQRRNRKVQHHQPTREEVIRSIASFECAPLRHALSHDHATLKKKIWMKWHPDKQPSPDHAALATQVVQELQNRAEWK